MSYNIVKKLSTMGFALTPVKFADKKPILSGWPNKRLTEVDLKLYFDVQDKFNIGVLLGKLSDGVVDVDLDTDLAAQFAKHLLPETDMIFGRNARPSTHYVYRASDIGPPTKYCHPVSGKAIVELRANGQQTVFPGSTHASGDVVRFETGKDGVPSPYDFGELDKRVRYVAATAILSEHWHQGNRHKLALALSGFCAANKVAQHDCEDMVSALCNVNGDEEMVDRLDCVTDSYNNFRNGERTLGITGLIGKVGEKAAGALREWIGVPEQAVGIQPSTQVTPMTIDLGTDRSAAESFAHAVKDHLLFSGKDGCFYRRMNDVYEPISQEQAMQSVIRFVDDQTKEPKSFQDQQAFKSIQSHARMKAILILSKSYLFVDASRFDCDRMLVGCSNGVLDLQTRKLIEPSTVVTKRLGTVFDEAARCPQFEAFIAKIMADDPELISYVKRAVGYSLTGSVAQQCMFVGIGSGANGKSTFQKVIQSLLGAYAASTPMSTLMVSKFGNDKTDDLASLPGKRLVCAQEGESSQSLAVAKIKMMTGGDRISCRPLYRNLFEFDPEFKLWLFTNELPQIPGGDVALWRRVHVLPFGVTIPEGERNAGLGGVLESELPGILNWALDGFADFQARGGLCAPSSVINATSSYRNESDVVRQFVDACCHNTSDPTDVTMMSDLYGRYEGWSKSSAVDPVSNVIFGKNLERLGFARKRTNKGNGRRGIRLKDIA